MVFTSIICTSYSMKHPHKIKPFFFSVFPSLMAQLNSSIYPTFPLNSLFYLPSFFSYFSSYYLLLSKICRVAEKVVKKQRSEMALTWTHKDTGEIRVHEDLEELSIDLVDFIAEISEASIKEHGAFCIVLSGGSLISLMGKLVEPPYDKIVDWAKWYVFWADERVVAKSHDDSNYKLAKDNLLSKVNVFPRHICSINDTVSAEEAAAEYEFAIRQMVRTRTVAASENSDCPKFDLILLGMGSDGHVASLFPNHPALVVKDDWVTFLTDSPKPPPERITFTLPVINSAANVVVVATGESKANAIHLALDDLPVPESSSSLPARLVHPSNGNLIWFMDKPAGYKLDRFKFSK